MSLLNFIGQIEIFPTEVIASQERDIKICQGCQETELETTVMRGERIAELTYNHEDYKHRADITKWELGLHEYGLLHKASLYVWHIPNHEECYNYKLEKVQHVFELSSDKTSPQPEIPYDLHVCPGHYEVLGHYSKLKNANDNGFKEEIRRKKEANVQTSRYKVLNKGSLEAKKHGCFKGVKWFSSYAVLMIYHHYAGSTKCPNHPNFNITRYIPIDQ